MAEPKRIVREILSASFCVRVGAAGGLDGDLELVTNRDVEIVPERHDLLGPGLRLRWRNRAGYSKFVPITNVRDVQYTEREEKG